MNTIKKHGNFTGLDRYIDGDRVDVVMIEKEVLRQLLAEGFDEEYAKGFAEGFAEGYAEGFAEGYAKGRAEKKMEIVRTMKADGLPIATIAKATGLSQEEIETI